MRAMSKLDCNDTCLVNTSITSHGIYAYKKKKKEGFVLRDIKYVRFYKRKTS